VNISIVSGWLPLVLRGLALVTLVSAVSWRSGGWKRHLGRGLPIAAVVTGVVALVLTFGSLVPSDFPWLAYVWASPSFSPCGWQPPAGPEPDAGDGWWRSARWC
jgi:hypothetical protein